jgi:two-component system response regulator (stage 0 sporulation protein F)
MGANSRVLVVEDEPVLRKLLRYFLGREGFTVRTASDGLEVLRAFEEEHPQIVLLDIRLPGIDGLEILRHVRRTAPETVVFVISGVLDEPTRIQAMALGALDCLEKPLDFRALKDRLASASALIAG